MAVNTIDKLQFLSFMGWNIGWKLHLF